MIELERNIIFIVRVGFKMSTNNEISRPHGNFIFYTRR